MNFFDRLLIMGMSAIILAISWVFPMQQLSSLVALKKQYTAPIAHELQARQVAECRRKNFVLIGPPGSGKGTFSFAMTQECGYYQICLGDIFRTHVKNKTKLGMAITANGGKVDDAVVYTIIEEQVSYCLQENHSFIIDGFPRNIPAFEFLYRLFEQKGISSTIEFMHFEAEDQMCIDRINSRLVCFKCSNVFNMMTKPALSTFQIGNK